MLENEYVSKITGEVVTIKFTDGLNVLLSNKEKMTSSDFFKNYTLYKKAN